MTETDSHPDQVAAKPDGKAVPGDDALDSIAIAAFDVDGRIFRTMWHSLIKAPDVVFAALQGDYSRYLSPVRVFVALFSFQFAFAAIIGTPLTVQLTPLAETIPPDAVAAWLALSPTEGLSLRDIDALLDAWLSLMMWPATLLSSLPFLILLKLYRPSLSWWGHVTVYLVPTNGSFLVMISALPLMLIEGELGSMLFMLGATLGMLSYFVLTGWIVARFYAKTALGVAGRLIGLIVLMPFPLLIMSVGQIFLVAYLVERNFGLPLGDFFELIASQ